MINIKLLAPKNHHRILVVVAIVLAVCLPLVHAHKAAAVAGQGLCSVDPEDLATPPPPAAADQSNCPTADSYIFTGDTTSPQIQVGSVNAGGETINPALATLSLVDAKADPLVWSGPASYDQHTIQVSISRSDFTKDFASPGGAGQFNRTDNPGPNQSTGGSANVRGTSGNSYNISNLSNFSNITCSDTNGQCNNVIVKKYLTPAVQFLSAGVGIIITAMVVIGGIEYSTAGGDPQKVSAAKQKIFNALIALLAFALLTSFLQFIVPGGIKII